MEIGACEVGVGEVDFEVRVSLAELVPFFDLTAMQSLNPGDQLAGWIDVGSWFGSRYDVQVMVSPGVRWLASWGCRRQEPSSKIRGKEPDAMLKNIPPGLEHIMSIHPEILGGEPCFNGTRVPLETVVDNLAAGVSVDRILRNYRTLTQEHVDAVLHWEHALAYKAAGLELHAS